MISSRAVGAALVCGAALLAACEQSRPVTKEVSPIVQSRERLSAALDECTRQHGYDPALSDTLGESELGAGELEWRECAYQALRTHSRSVPDMTDRYEMAISADREMTKQVQEGRLTRSERRWRTEEMMDQIVTAEDVRIETEEGQKAREEQLRGLTDMFQQSLR